MQLTELDPTVELSPFAVTAQRLFFLCPLCRKRRISVDYWEGPSGEISLENRTFRLWNAKPPVADLSTLTLAPSIDHQHGLVTPERPCPGWHGFITNGEVT